ncbi:MAG: NAD-dependent epimerase/dehydratase family protein [Spirochaetales bacterium]|nr:NAD-dependent epimerase/dehydratase family protein [Spirochaetales bacterium]
MNIIVIGGSGFVGSLLVQRLLDLKHTVTIIDKRKSELFPKLWKFGDIRDLEGFQALCKGGEVIINLAAEHRDDVTPISLYYDVNVGGSRNVCIAASKNKINRIIFTSSVAIYGVASGAGDEDAPRHPFNHYGKSKLEAESVYNEWQAKSKNHTLSIIRPTVIFGENNRGNVYNLLKQMASNKFLMVGNGKNVKSMAYIKNIVEFIIYNVNNPKPYLCANYTDKPDFSMNELVGTVMDTLGKKLFPFRAPFFLALLGGYVFDFAAFITRKKLPISSIRIKKFCMNTRFSSKYTHTGFAPPYTLREGLIQTITYEFINPPLSRITFTTE